jgi:hypothetical protein
MQVVESQNNQLKQLSIQESRINYHMIVKLQRERLDKAYELYCCKHILKIPRLYNQFRDKGQNPQQMVEEVLVDPQMLKIKSEQF